MRNAKRQVGLSLVEMLVVVAIIMVVAGLAVTLTSRLGRQAKERDLASAFAMFKGALQEYREETGEFPPQPERNYANAPLHMRLLYERLMAEPASRQVLSHLAGFPTQGDQTSLEVAEVRDPWGTVLDYRSGPDDDFPELISAGPDREFGTEDDINSRTG
jgi:type II secretory pathway pseudopilin PulG